jgi:hypothetical protein
MDLFGPNFPTFNLSFETPAFGAIGITLDEVTPPTTLSEVNYLPFYQISSSPSPVSLSLAAATPMFPNYPIMGTCESCFAESYPSSHTCAYVPPPTPEPCPHCPNPSSCYQTSLQTPSTSEYAPPPSYTWSTTLTVDTTLCTLPYSLPQHPNSPRCFSAPSTPVLPSHKHHRYNPKIRARSHSPPTAKNSSNHTPISRQKQSRKSDHSGEFRRIFNKLLELDKNAANAWENFQQMHGCPKNRACIRAFLAFCDARTLQQGDADAFTQLRSNPKWRRLGSRTDCHCTSFSPSFNGTLSLSPSRFFLLSFRSLWLPGSPD